MTNAIRYEAAGDEFLVAELDEQMSLETNIRVMGLTRAIAERDVPGIVDICPANVAYMVRYDPEQIEFAVLVAELQAAEAGLPEPGDVRLSTRLIELPVLYADPWTHEAVASSRDLHQDPSSTDLEYAARINGHPGVAEFIDAHRSSPWFVSMTGFVPGAAWYYQMVPRSRQIEVPKYLRPRTHTPARAVGHGGAFAAVYPVPGAGGYQLFGISAAPVLDVDRSLPDFADSMTLVRPGDIVSFRAIDLDEYAAIRAEVDAGSFRFSIREAVFDPGAFRGDPDGYNDSLLAGGEL